MATTVVLLYRADGVYCVTNTEATAPVHALLCERLPLGSTQKFTFRTTSKTKLMTGAKGPAQSWPSARTTTAHPVDAHWIIEAASVDVMLVAGDAETWWTFKPDAPVADAWDSCHGHWLERADDENSEQWKLLNSVPSDALVLTLTTPDTVPRFSVFRGHVPATQLSKRHFVLAASEVDAAEVDFKPVKESVTEFVVGGRQAATSEAAQADGVSSNTDTEHSDVDGSVCSDDSERDDVVSRAVWSQATVHGVDYLVRRREIFRRAYVAASGATWFMPARDLAADVADLVAGSAMPCGTAPELHTVSIGGDECAVACIAANAEHCDGGTVKRSRAPTTTGPSRLRAAGFRRWCEEALPPPQFAAGTAVTSAESKTSIVSNGDGIFVTVGEAVEVELSKKKARVEGDHDAFLQDLYSSVQAAQEAMRNA